MLHQISHVCISETANRNTNKGTSSIIADALKDNTDFHIDVFSIMSGLCNPNRLHLNPIPTFHHPPTTHTRVHAYECKTQAWNYTLWTSRKTVRVVWNSSYLSLIQVWTSSKVNHNNKKKHLLISFMKVPSLQPNFLHFIASGKQLNNANFPLGGFPT